MNNDLELIQTKVSPESRARLNAICEERGITIYLLLQMVADCLIRYMDSNTNLSEDMARLMRIFEGMVEWKDAYNLCGEEKGRITEAFYVMRRKRKKGERLVHVTEELFGKRNMTYNVQEMLDRFICVINPSLYRHLRTIGAELGLESVYEIIAKLADEYVENPDEKELRLQFENNNWVERAQETGRKRFGSTDQAAYKRTRHTDMDSFDAKQQKLFNDDD